MTHLLARPVVYYGWWVVLASIAIQFFIGGLFTQAYGPYVVLLRAEFGWSATLVSLGFAMVRLEGSVLGPLEGWLVDRYGPRVVVRVGAVVFAGGFVLFSQVSTVPTFLAALVVIAIGASLSGFATLNVAVVQWFPRGLSTALGISTIGNFSAPLLLPLVVLVLGSAGWRTTAIVTAVAALLLIVPASQLLRRGAPHEVSAADKRRDSLSVPDDAPVVRHFTAREALRARQFWYLSAGHACAVFVVSAVLVHLVPHLTSSLGFTLAQASWVAAVLAIMTITGSLIGGFVGDRVSRRDLVVTAMVSHAAALLFLAFAAAAWMLALFAVLHGLAWGVRGPLMAALRAEYFGTAAFGTISGFSALVLAIGNAGGPLVAGIAYDVTGSYAAGFTIIAVVAILGAGFFVLASRAAASRRYASW